MRCILGVFHLKFFISLVIHFYCKSKNSRVCKRLKIKTRACHGGKQKVWFVENILEDHTRSTCPLATITVGPLSLRVLAQASTGPIGTETPLL